MNNKEPQYLNRVPNGVLVDTLVHIPAISSYNSNYYSFSYGDYNNQLLYGKSDDDAITEWFLMRGDLPPAYIGYSDQRDEHHLIIRERGRNT